MNLIRKTGIAFAFLCVLAPVLGFAQYQHRVSPFWSNLGNSQRYELGGQMVMGAGTFTGVVRVLDGGGAYKYDTTVSRKIGNGGFGGAIGLCLPFKGTGHISCWAVAASLQGNIYAWPDLNPTATTGGEFKSQTPGLTAGTIQVALPIGIDWKVGNDAILTKRLTFGASFGAGVTPQIMNTVLADVDGFKGQWGYGCNPYVKFDWSIFMGLCWKFRFMYNMGSINILDVNHKIPGANDGPFKINMGNSFTIGLVVMPFSGKWREDSWYNTYDTYNQHDRFN